MDNNEIFANKKEFDLGAILNITTKRLITNMEDVYEVLNYLTGDIILTHQFSKVIPIVREYILSIYPELTGIGDNIEINSIEDAKSFTNEQKKVFGDKLPLSPIEKKAYYANSFELENEMKHGR